MTWPSTNSPAPRAVAEWSPALIGVLVRAAVQHCVLEPITALSNQHLQLHAEAVLPPGLATIHRLMVTQRVGQGLAVWLDAYDPRPDWRPLGIEAAAGKLRIDLLWINASGNIRADHLRSGALNARARAEAARIHDAGHATFGPAWRGVRLISLQPSSMSYEHIGRRLGS
jgi:hypothetical protein